MGYYTGELIESVVYYLNKINLTQNTIYFSLL